MLKGDTKWTKKNRLHKALLLSTLTFTQCISTVALVQNSIVQTYAEEKNKDVTSQQFLDYINDLKQKYPNFKFEENTTVYNSLQEAQQAVMHLYADGVDTGKSVTLDTSNNWEYTFTGLRKYNGNQEIQYSIKEDEMNFYITSVAGDMDNGFNITNTWNEQHELPGDAPTVEIPEFKITTFVNTNNEQIAEFENGFTDKKDEITFNNVKYVFKEKLPDQDGIRTYVYEEFHSEVPNDAPEVTLPELKVTRFVDENGTDIHELEENFVEKKEISGYVYKETTETSDIRTHVYTKVETEVPNDAPTVEVPELKITRFIDTNGVELKNIVEGFVEKDSNITYEDEQYDYVNTTEEDGIRTHVYKKHVAEEVPSNNTTTPTDNNTTTENKVIVEHTAPTGDSMNNTLNLFALSVLGLGFVLLKRKDLSNE